MYVRATSAPLWASCHAIAAPMPRLPPVTSATFPSKSDEIDMMMNIYVSFDTQIITSLFLSNTDYVSTNTKKGSQAETRPAAWLRSGDCVAASDGGVLEKGARRRVPVRSYHRHGYQFSEPLRRFR